MPKKSWFDQTRRARWSRTIFQQARKVLSGSCQSATTRSSSSAWRSCEQEFAFRRPPAAFRVLSSSVARSCNHEFAFRHHLAAFQPRVSVLPSSSSVSRSCNHEVTFRHLHCSASFAAFQTTSSYLRAAFQSEYFAVQWFIWIQKHSAALNREKNVCLSQWRGREPFHDTKNIWFFLSFMLKLCDFE